MSACRSCGAAIVWLKTAAGKSMPVDAGSVKPPYGDYDPKRHVAHWGTCPDAKKWSRKKKKVELLP